MYKAVDNHLIQCAHVSRLIGSDPDLVLHGGGNTSVKIPYTDITGRSIDALYVKGSGWDLANIEAEGFVPLRQERLLELLQLEELSDLDMMSELAAAKLVASAPSPSVESLLHAWLPHRFVLHSHADAIVSLTNTVDGHNLVRATFPPEMLVVPYVMPGFKLARAVAQLRPDRDYGKAIGMVLMNHGLFTFADDAESAYDQHLQLINQAEGVLRSNDTQTTAHNRTNFKNGGTGLEEVVPAELAKFRKEISEAAGRPMIMQHQSDPDCAVFLNRPDLADLTSRGPLTPDHVIRTKRIPMVGRDVGKFVEEYRQYFQSYQHRTPVKVEMLDPAPRVALVPGWGVFTVGENVKAANVGWDIYRHTMKVLSHTEDHMGGYQALAPEHYFDCEYWELEQAKLKRGGPPPPLEGMVAIVTGAASGIGKATCVELLRQGAAVAGFDIDEDVISTFSHPSWQGVCVDVTDAKSQREAIAAVANLFGGIDIVVAAAGIFGDGQEITDLETESWDAIYNINLKGVAELLQQTHPILSHSPVGGRVVLVGSKNVAAPGRGAGAYSSSKAALTQLGRVAALEWASAGIRVNTVHPDGVFDTGLWSESLLEERAAQYEMTVEQYKTRNLLGREVTSADVADVIVSLCGDTFRSTTGAQIPVDGGNERVI